MSKSVNKVIIIGNLGKDPEIKDYQGKNIGNITVATSESYKDKSGEWKETTEWHRITLWDYLADKALKHLTKGSKVYIEGKLQTRSYEKDGQTIYVTEIKAKELVLLDKSNNESYERPKTNNFKSSPSRPEANELESDDIPF